MSTTKVKRVEFEHKGHHLVRVWSVETGNGQVTNFTHLNLQKSGCIFYCSNYYSVRRWVQAANHVVEMIENGSHT